MSQQLGPFGISVTYVMPAARSRHTDPITSTIAADKHAQGLGAQARRVLDLVTRFPGKTACELANEVADGEVDYMRLRYMISRRCPDLARVNFLRKGKQRECEVTGSMQLTWEPLP